MTIAIFTVQAAQWYRKAAEAGHPDGQSWYGTALLTGKGVEKNSAEAVKWFQKAADQGNDSGAYWLGLCLTNGWGIEKDFSEARKWLQLAAKEDWLDAKYRLRLLFFQKYDILKWRNRVIAVVGWFF